MIFIVKRKFSQSARCSFGKNHRDSKTIADACTVVYLFSLLDVRALNVYKLVNRGAAMVSQGPQDPFDRRAFLQAAGVLTLGLGAAALLGSEEAEAEGKLNRRAKPWRGLFPIGQTPFTPDDKLDFDCLAAEVGFCNRGGIPGLLWPQGSSGWTTLSEKERLDGAEAMLAAGKGGKTALIIGVQPLDGEVNTAIRYARHAAKHGADGLVSLPPGIDNGRPGIKLTPQEHLDYYKALGAATDLPLMVQSHGDMSVDLIVTLYQQVPTLKGVKDETGDTLTRLPEFRRRTNNEFVVMDANGAIQMLDGMRLGFDGYVPKTGLADLSQMVFDLWSAGKNKEAFNMFGRIQAFQTIRGAMQYILTARGVFKETTTIRDAHRIFGANGVTPDEAQRKVIREELTQFLGPYLRA
jgi:dihydrodipicolinate synthase/N-acetylneuraminate lyase